METAYFIIMEKYFVTKEIAEALAEIGCVFNTPFYYDLSNYVEFDVEVYMGYDDVGHNEVVSCDFDNFQTVDVSGRKIFAPTIHEALEWFESKGERYNVKADFDNYVAEVMQEGEFMTIGKYKSRKEAEESIMKFYIRTKIEDKIDNLKKLTEI